MLTIKAMSDGETYASHHLSNNDYYSVGESVTGQWIGRGAELLGLKGDVTMEQFESIRLARDPNTGEFLRQRQSANRFNKDGEQIATARNLYDFTVSAPKDLSIQAMEDPRLIEAHKAGVAEMTVEMERLAGVGVRKNGAKDTAVTSNLVIAKYDHDTSRELDPQLHTHLVAGNLTWHAAEQEWKALNAIQIYAQREYLTEVYRNAVARVVTDLGYQIEDRLEHGKDNGFGIIGIKEVTREKYSQRSAQRDAAIAEFLDKNGRLPSNNEIALLVRDTRPEKLKEISTAEVKAGQRARLSPEEAQTLSKLCQTALERGSIREPAPAGPSLAFASEHVFERVSVAKDYELKTEALRHGRGRIELLDLKAEILTNVAAGSMLEARGDVATRETLARERRMVEAIDKDRGRYEPLGRGNEFVVSDMLRPEQKAAVLATLASRDLAFNISGAAGVGKTFTLKELDRGLREARVNLTTVAPSARAVQVLQADGLPNAMTIARLLADPKQQEQLTRAVLLIDEAGMVSSNDMHSLLKLAKDKDARIVFSGDTAQIKSVEEGDALRMLECESNLQTVSLREVRRQLDAEYREAMEALRSTPAEGYQRLEKMGAIREVDWRLIGKETARAWREASAVPNIRGQERSVLVVARTHDQIKSITHAIREDRKAAGELGEGRIFEKHTALDWTEAQKKQMKRYRPGQALIFHRAVKDIAKNESLEVVSANKDGLRARKSDGREISLTGKQTMAYGVFEKEQLEVSTADKLLLQANWKEKGKNGFRATNGELVTVASVDGERIRLKDGRELPPAYKQFTSGYAVTAHVGQGDSADFVVAAPDGMRRDLAYVALTRGKEGLTVVTSDAIALQQSIGISGDRQSATELAQRAQNIARIAPRSVGMDDYQLYRLGNEHRGPAILRAPQLQQEIKHDTGHAIGF